MAFSFKPEDGTGLSHSNSYSSFAFADSYHSGRGNTAWTDGSITTDAKKEALVRATDHIDKRFGQRFVGDKASQSQGLAWPRDNAVDRDDFEIPTPDWEDATIKSLTDDTIKLESHGFDDGDRVQVRGKDGGSLPGGLSADTDYFVIDVDSDTIKLEATEGGGAINLTSDPGTFQVLEMGGVPLVVQKACAEYAIVALDIHELNPRPPLPVPEQSNDINTTDSNDETNIGEVAEQEKTIGPITKRTRYKERSQIRPQSGPLPVYSAADLLLKPVLRRGGRVVRA